MIGINKQCEMCRNLKTDNDGGQVFFYCDENEILDEGEEKICLGFQFERMRGIITHANARERK